MKHSLWLLYRTFSLFIPKYWIAILGLRMSISLYDQAKTSLNSTNNLKYFLSSSGVRSALTKIGRGYFRVPRFSSLRSSMFIVRHPPIEREPFEHHHLYHQCLDLLPPLCDGIIVSSLNLPSEFPWILWWFHETSWWPQLCFFSPSKNHRLWLTISLHTWWENILNLFVVSYTTKIFTFMLQKPPFGWWLSLDSQAMKY